MSHCAQFSFEKFTFLPHALPNCCYVNSSVLKLGKSLSSNFVLNVKPRKFCIDSLAFDNACLQDEERLPRIPLGWVRVKRCCPLLAWAGYQHPDNNNKQCESLTASQRHAQLLDPQPASLALCSCRGIFIKDFLLVNSRRVILSCIITEKLYMLIEKSVGC